MFDNANQRDTNINELVSQICKLAGCLEGRTSATDREAALHDTLKVAYQLEEVINQKNERIDYLDRLCMTDSLTGILNRRGFQEELKRVLASARRFKETGVLAYVDLDDFKEINDTHGHACGDEVLCHVSRLMSEMIRGMDYVARLGGDEFAILLVRTQWDGGQNRIEKIAHKLNTTVLGWENQLIPLKASIGLQYYDHRSFSQDLLNAADESMYAIKKFKTTRTSHVHHFNAAE